MTILRYRIDKDKSYSKLRIPLYLNSKIMPSDLQQEILRQLWQFRYIVANHPLLEGWTIFEVEE